MKRRFGAQIYTVRDHMQTEAEFRSTMIALAEMGFRGIHTAGIGKDISEDAMISGIRDAGLSVILTHVSAARVKDDTDAIIEFHKKLGCNIVGVGSIATDPTYDNHMRFFENMAPAIEKIHAAGMLFSYHNHHWEFQHHNGKTYMEHILDATDPETVKICFDAYWAHYAGMDETQFILDHGDRVLTTHTKDMVTFANGTPGMTEMLTGNINYDRFFNACDQKGIEWHFIEQDRCIINSIDSIRISRNNLVARYGNDND